MDGRYEPAHRFQQWTFARRERRGGMLIVFKWNSASRYCAESSWSSWWKILSIDCLHKTTAIDSQNIAVCVCVCLVLSSRIWTLSICNAYPHGSLQFWGDRKRSIGVKIHGHHGAKGPGENVGKMTDSPGPGGCWSTHAHVHTRTLDRQTAASIMGKLMEMIHGWIHTATHNDGINSERIYTQSGKSSICKLTNYMTEWHIQPACPSTPPRTHKHAHARHTEMSASI